MNKNQQIMLVLLAEIVVVLFFLSGYYFIEKHVEETTASADVYVCVQYVTPIYNTFGEYNISQLFCNKNSVGIPCPNYTTAINAGSTRVSKE